MSAQEAAAEARQVKEEIAVVQHALESAKVHTNSHHP